MQKFRVRQRGLTAAASETTLELKSIGSDENEAEKSLVRSFHQEEQKSVIDLQMCVRLQFSSLLLVFLIYSRDCFADREKYIADKLQKQREGMRASGSDDKEQQEQGKDSDEDQKKETVRNFSVHAMIVCVCVSHAVWLNAELGRL